MKTEQLTAQEKLDVLYEQRLFVAQVQIRRLRLYELEELPGVEAPLCQENDSGQAKI